MKRTGSNMWFFREFATSARFIFITGDQGFWHSKRVYEFVCPIIGTFIFTLVYYFIREYMKDGFISNMFKNLFDFVIFIVPFQLASLSVFATYNKKGLDDKLSGTNARVAIWSNEDNLYHYELLTLRQYSSLMFGYLCTIGIFYVFIYILISHFDYNRIYGSYIRYGEYFSLMVLLFFLFHYIFLTIYAITFLFDKIQFLRK